MTIHVGFNISYISMKNAVHLFKKEHTYKNCEFLLSEISSLDPDANGVLDLGSEWISCLHAKADL